MELAGHAIGVCSWSLKCSSHEELLDALQRLGLAHVQLALGGLCDAGDGEVDRVRQLYASRKVTITSGMIGFHGEDYSTIAIIRQTGGFVPDAKWDERRRVVEAAGRCAKRLGLAAVSTHIGFVPPSSQAGYEVMVQRLRAVAEIFGALGLALYMETGQESAAELLQFINDVAKTNVAVNFDPANMILYGAGAPVDAIQILGRHIRHVHIKDAVESSQPGVLWGEEVPFGKGQVSAQAFLGALRAEGYRGPLIIEREAGASRFADVQQAVAVMDRALAAERS